MNRFAIALLLHSLVLSAGVIRPDARTIFYYVPTDDAWKSLQDHADKISIVAPQVFVAKVDGSVEGAVEERVRALAKQKGIEIMPLLTNLDFKPEAARAAFASDHAISDSVRLCKENGCAGLQLDFEAVADEDSAAYQAFIGKMAAALHEAKLYFSIALPSPLFQGGRPLRDYKSTYGGFVLGSFRLDLKDADFVSLMAYDLYHGNTAPGPVAAYPWVEQSIRFFLQYVPASKLSLGIPFYGRRWCSQKADELSFPGIQQALQRAKARVRRQAWGRVPTFDYPEGGCSNIVFYEDRKSLREKLRLVNQFHLSGLSAWRIGQEDPAFWEELPRVRRKSVSYSQR